jgi:peptidyl-Lys metalloendopeptidase
MKILSGWLATAALLSLSVSIQAQAQAGGLSITLSSDAQTLNATQDVMVNVTMTNFSAEPIQVLRWYTPLQPASTGLFRVTRNGEPVNYVGALVKRGAPKASDYVTIPAGSSITRSVNVSEVYEFSATGVYTLEYDVASMHTYRGALPVNALSSNAAQRAVGQMQELTSNAIAMTVKGGETTAAVDVGVSEALVTPSFASTVTTIGCSSTRQGQIATALSSAESYASNSVSYLNGGRTGPRYTTWFGTVTSSRYSTVTTHFRNISNAASTKPLQFDCSTCPAGPNANAFAYVFAGQPYRIYLCNAFWAAPNTGTDSRAGTIVHELSHFSILAGTSDFAYGQSAAKQLALQDPNRAVQNADNHEYFGENTPLQN